ncbi:ATP-dependent DNA helicase RecQ [Evansella caseinilytica]|uniref:ATP-dependent DNA helicase RecQ n=1 Tax=Evansella caseinilytica TaxID=1503961 RepID=A0A1H3V420_9BACI|nr:RecQ family ATP-dependent DNA helicase [Evansella caseinilytica]SDZ68809.1 ATP-dependent DNA helicase RecQ [Evansella caseinilytica]
MNTELEHVLEENFGFTHFREGQKEIILSVMKGRNVLAILPTGAGKTLCYHFPAKLLDGITIVVSPLLSLMEDQVHQMRASGEKAVVQLNGLLSFTEKEQVLSELHHRSIVFVSPEMLANDYLLKKLRHWKVGLFVVDEAHCISQWGHEFRTDYLRLSDARAALGEPPCLALTATATAEVEKDILGCLAMENAVVHRFSVNRPQIKYFIEECASEEEKQSRFREYITQVASPAIVYTGTRNDAVQLSNEIRETGISSTAYYHGGLAKEERLLIQRQFLHDELRVICATTAFGMGINKPDIRTVVHMHLPSSIEQYVQEVGRAGRDGKESAALLLYTKADRYRPLSFIEQEFLTEKELSALFRVLKGSGGTVAIKDIPAMLQLDETVWRMVMYYLEKAAAVKAGRIAAERLNEELLATLHEHFTKRRRQKQSLFLQLERLFTENSCIRSGILAYFGENQHTSPAFCCSACGFRFTDMPGFDPHPRPADESGKSNEITWQEELQHMLLPHKRGR